MYIVRGVCVCVCVCVCWEDTVSESGLFTVERNSALYPRICQRPPWKLCVLQEPRKGFWLTVSFHALRYLLKAWSLPVSSPVQLNQRFSKFPLSAGLGLGPEGDTPEWEKVCALRETGTIQAPTEEALKEELLRSWVRGHSARSRSLFPNPPRTWWQRPDGSQRFTGCPAGFEQLEGELEGGGEGTACLFHRKLHITKKEHVVNKPFSLYFNNTISW